MERRREARRGSGRCPNPVASTLGWRRGRDGASTSHIRRLWPVGRSEKFNAQMTKSDFVPLANPAADLAPLREKLITAATRVIDRGSYVLGMEVAEFEQRMANRLGVLGTVGVASGTDALVLALLALGIGSGDEVITVSHTAGPTVAAIHMVGATPVLVD